MKHTPKYTAIGLLVLDPTVEQVYPLSKIPQTYPFQERRGGKKISKSTIWRWAMHGCRGVKLETLATPSGLVTSHEAIGRFFAALSGNGPQSVDASQSTSSPTVSARRQRAIADAEAQLSAAGI